MEEIIRRAFEEYNLKVFIGVFQEIMSVRLDFMINIIFMRQLIFLRRYGIAMQEMKNLKWYSVLKGDVLDERRDVVGCKIVHINTIPTVDAGRTLFF